MRIRNVGDFLVENSRVVRIYVLLSGNGSETSVYPTIARSRLTNGNKKNKKQPLYFRHSMYP